MKYSKAKVLLDKGNCVDRSNTQWDAIAAELHKSQKVMKTAKDAVDYYKDKLTEYSEGQASVGKKYAFTYTVAKGNVNYKIIPVLQKMDLEPYRNGPVTRWKLEEL